MTCNFFLSMLRSAVGRLSHSRRPSSSFCSSTTSFQWDKIKAANWTELAENGFSVVEDVLEPHLLHSMKQETNLLFDNNRMVLNHTHLVHNKQTKLLPKSSILEAEMAVEEQYEYAPVLSSLFRSDSLAQVANSNLCMQADRQMIKVQRNLGHGGCFPFHFDTNGSDGRIMTAILYLNDPWKEEWGGELELFPFPFTPHKIIPKNNRMVLFSSQHMLHRVAPSYNQRDCLTVWLYQTPANANKVPLTFPWDGQMDQEWKIAMHTLLQGPLRRHFGKWFYQAEWERSIAASHPATPETSAAIEVHRKDVQIIEKALSQILSKRLHCKHTNLSSLRSRLPLSSSWPGIFFE